MILKLFISVVIGIVIGWDRERKGKPTGIRTCSLVVLGTCLFTLLSQTIPSSYIDRGHLVANLPQALGFLCAGAILRQDTRVFGLTSAAVLWVLGGIGIAIGFGYYAMAILASIFTIGIISFADYLQYKKIFKPRRKK
jgi:putative Mg2+ transporter-C (MgtC) family protein